MNIRAALFLGLLAPASLQAGRVEARDDSFDASLYRQLAGTPGNLVFSPYSVRTALALAFVGARGLTAEQMASVLGLPLDASGAALSVRAQMEAITADAARDSIEVLIANRLWGEQGLNYQPTFISTLASELRAPLEQVSFSTEAENVRLAINSWVAQNTKDHIPKLFVPGSISAQDRLVLANAIYFDGDWNTPFDARLTKDAPFHLASGEVVDAPTMHRSGTTTYAENEKAQVIRLPYSDGAFEMTIVLPRQVDLLPKIESEVTSAQVLSWIEGAARARVNISLPRFEARRQYDLVEPLSRLGMQDAFSDRADFTGISNEVTLFISSVVHEAWIRVDETGTEAAAATGVVMRTVSEVPVATKEFRADHPFLYLVRHVPTGTILFMGRVENPLASADAR